MSTESSRPPSPTPDETAAAIQRLADVSSEIEALRDRYRRIFDAESLETRDDLPVRTPGDYANLVRFVALARMELEQLRCWITDLERLRDEGRVDVQEADTA